MVCSAASRPRKIVLVVRDAMGAGIEHVFNDTLNSAAFFLASRILIVEWIEAQQNARQRNVDRLSSPSVSASTTNGSAQVSGAPSAPSVDSTCSPSANEAESGQQVSSRVGPAVLSGASLDPDVTAARARVGLLFQALNRLSETWPVADKLLDLVRLDLATKLEDVHQLKVGKGNCMNGACPRGYVRE